MPDDRVRSDSGALLLPLALIAGLVVLLVLDPAPAPAPTHSGLEALLKQIVGYVALAAEAGAALVIAAAVLRGLWECVVVVARPSRRQMHETEHVRLRVGRLLVLGLEFTVAADILSTAIAPSREALTMLTLVVLLRTFLSLVLEREVRALEARRADLGDAGGEA